MTDYQIIGKLQNGEWTNFDMDYFSSFDRAKDWVEKYGHTLNDIWESKVTQVGLQVYNHKTDQILDMFWEYKNGKWSRNYND